MRGLREWIRRLWATLRPEHLPWLDDVARDVSYGLRSLKRRPGFTATAMLSLALGIGANPESFRSSTRSSSAFCR